MSPRIGKSLSRAVALAGGVSRRVAQGAVISGRVTLDGEVCRRPAARVVEPAEVTLDGVVLPSLDSLGDRTVRLWRYHKPRGLITTHADPEGRPTVFDSLPSTLPRLVSAGRLDRESEGLLMLTTHGSLARRLEHPSSGFVRVYQALLSTGQRAVTPDMLAELAAGLTLTDGSVFRPIRATLLERERRREACSRACGRSPIDDGARAARMQWVRMELTEGQNREVRQAPSVDPDLPSPRPSPTCPHPARAASHGEPQPTHCIPPALHQCRRAWAHFGFATASLVRTSYGPFALGELAAGELDEVAPGQVAALVDGTPRTLTS